MAVLRRAPNMAPAPTIRAEIPATHHHTLGPPVFGITPVPLLEPDGVTVMFTVREAVAVVAEMAFPMVPLAVEYMQFRVSGKVCVLVTFGAVNDLVTTLPVPDWLPPLNVKTSEQVTLDVAVAENVDPEVTLMELTLRVSVCPGYVATVACAAGARAAKPSRAAKKAAARAPYFFIWVSSIYASMNAFEPVD